MKTTSEILQDALLHGQKLNKFDFLNMANSVCLAQRILELRQMGWNIRDRAVMGKGNLREYWLEQDEIERILARNRRVEQLVAEVKNDAETSRNEPVEEQMSLLIGGRNY